MGKKEDLLEPFRKMLLIRRLEEELVKYYLANKIMSFVHFSIGHENCAVAVCNNLTNEDFALGNHRSHHHFLAKGGNPGELVAEMLGKKSGCANGNGGSMHPIAKEVGFLGSTPILGPVVSIGAGAALAKKLKKEKGVVVSFLGDGASETGVFYETCNFAALHELPFVMVIENNLFCVNSPLSARRSSNRITRGIVESFGLIYEEADGNCFGQSNFAAKRIIDRAKGGKPGVLELFTHRHKAHSAPINDEKFRIQDPIEIRDKQDCISRMYEFVKDYPETDKIKEEVELEVAAAMEFGINAE